jgi:RNA polymerase sigma-70 factor (ECF subfamily)
MSSNAHLQLVSPSPGQEEHSDDYLMALTAEGRTWAFTKLVSRHERAVRSLCALLLRDEAHARDVAQEVFLKVWERREKYRASGKFKVFVLTLARNLCHSAGRRRRVLGFLGLEEAPEASVATSHPVDVAVNAEAQLLLSRALQKLPENFRVPVALRYVDGLDYADIAKVIGRTESAARSRVHYGLKHLSELLPKEVVQ